MVFTVVQGKYKCPNYVKKINTLIQNYNLIGGHEFQLILVHSKTYSSQKIQFLCLNSMYFPFTHLLN